MPRENSLFHKAQSCRFLAWALRGIAAMRNATLPAMCRLAKRHAADVFPGNTSTRTPLSWRCRRGHCWKAMPTNVSKGSWCPESAHRKRLTLREMRALAERRAGECLSDRYINNGTKLAWRCPTRTPVGSGSRIGQGRTLAPLLRTRGPFVA